jgi:hypothetical protein
MFPNSFFHCYNTTARTLSMNFRILTLQKPFASFIDQCEKSRWFSRYSKQVMGWTIQGPISLAGGGGAQDFLSSPNRPQRSCSPANLLYNGYRVLYRVTGGRGLTFTTHLI